MKLVVGLGNPGKEYEGTRHSVGCFIVDELTNYQLPSASWRTNYQLIKSTVFMNESGRFVKKLVDRYKLPLDELLIIHDDLDVPLGDFRLQKGRGAAGHKGVESVISAMDSCDFWRLRVGIGRPPQDVDAEDYVLGRFDGEELEKIRLAIPEIIKKIKEQLEGHD